MRTATMHRGMSLLVAAVVCGCAPTSDPEVPELKALEAIVQAYTGEQVRLRVKVTGLADTTVDWSTSQSIGSLSPDGLYVSPASLPVDSVDVLVTVASRVQPSLRTTTTVRVYSRKIFQFAYDLEGARSMCLTSDGGFAMALEGVDLSIARIDSNGEVASIARYGQGRTTAVLQTTDGGFIIAGMTASPEAIVLIKTHATGSVQWQHNIAPTAGRHAVFALRSTSDGGLLLGGSVTDTVGPSIVDRGAIFKTDAAGMLQWWRKLPGFRSEFDGSVVELTDGSIVAVTTNLSGSGIVLSKFDHTGTPVWDRSVSLPESETVVAAIDVTSNGGFIISASSGSGMWNFQLVRTNADGNVIWRRSFGAGSLNWASAVRQTPDGGFVMCGWSMRQQFKLHLIKTGPTGGLEWEGSYGGLSGWAYGYSVHPLPDGRIAVAGRLDGRLFLVRASGSGGAAFLRRLF